MKCKEDKFIIGGVHGEKKGISGVADVINTHVLCQLWNIIKETSCRVNFSGGNTIKQQKIDCTKQRKIIYFSCYIVITVVTSL